MRDVPSTVVFVETLLNAFIVLNTYTFLSL